MRWRSLLSLRSRIRDLAIIALAVQHFWAGLSGWISLSAGLALATAVSAAMATVATTHSKAVNTEDRVNGLVTDVGNANATIATLNQGIFSDVDGATVTLTTGSGSVTLRADALSKFGSANQTTFLAALQKMAGEGQQGLGSSGFGGGVWTAAQSSALQTLQAQMNGGISGLNALLTRLQDDNYMS
jgi:hypothetical protein